MAYLFISNSDQPKYDIFSNGPASQYSMKNDQYLKDLISSAGIMKNHWHDDYGTRNTEKKTSKHEDFKKGNK